MRRRRRRMPGLSLPGLLVTLVLVLAQAAHAAEFYYMVVFGNERRPNRPKYTHTFATFVQATGEGASPDKYQIESHTISWSPADLDISLRHLHPQRGVNLDLACSLQWALDNKATLYQWGPFQIEKELYDRAVRQVIRLESGAVQFKVLDDRYRPCSASNCIHAVSDIVQDRGLLPTGFSRGAAGSQLVVRHLERWMIRPWEIHEWVGRRLGLEAYPIIRRRLETAPADDSLACPANADGRTDTAAAGD